MTPSMPRVAATLLADPPEPSRHQISLMHGWVPTAVQVVTIAALVLAVGRRTRRWRLLWLPVAGLVGVGAAWWAHWSIASDGLADDPAPLQLWAWIGLSGLAGTVLIVGWRGSRWWRRGFALLAVPLCLLSTGLALNLWVGYFPTVETAWNQVSAGPLPDQTDQATVTAMAAKTSAKAAPLPPNGSVVAVTIPADASQFKHRGELVYLPPAWFATSPPPKLPTIMMIGGEFNTPADWLRTGNAIATIDTFAAAHGGNAPVFVFVDSGGSFNNDTECVNGPRGKAADHLTKDVVPFMISNFGVSPSRANWGVAGWSMGGTCAVDLTMMHPDVFSTFLDIAGDLSPNSGNKDQTIARLYGGDATAWADFDPATVITRHGPYTGISGWFAISGSQPAQRHNEPVANNDAVGMGGRDATGNPGDQATAAKTLCALGAQEGIDCAVVAQLGKHDWPFASRAFAAALPWMAGAIGTLGDPVVPLPQGPQPEPSAEVLAPDPAAHAQAARR